jgi:hypothetical protein
MFPFRMSSLYFALNNLESKEVADCHFYGKAVARLEQDVEHGGAYAGPLTAQHVIGVEVSSGPLPNCLIEHAEIGASTATYKYLVRSMDFNHLRTLLIHLYQ